MQLQRLGDVLLTSTLLADLRREFPHATVDFLVGDRASAMLDGHPLIAERIIYDRRHPLRMLRLIRSRRYDWVIDLQSSPRTAQVALASGARRRAGWQIVGPWRLVYTHQLPRHTRPAVYVPRERQRMLELLGVPTVPGRPRLYLDEAERARGLEDARALGIGQGTPAVGLLLSAHQRTREWPPRYFAALAERLDADGVLPVVFQMPGDEDKIAEFRRRTGAGQIAAIPELRRFLGVLAACRAFVSGDTGPAHMAMALDVPTVTIYGPTNPENWNPGLPTTVIVQADKAGCPACARGEGSADPEHDCLDRVPVDVVHARLAELLQTTGAGA